MNPKFTYLFILVIHFLSLFYHISSNNSEDGVALLAIKSRITHDPHGVLNSWNHSLPICKWHGVTCGTRRPHRVVRLVLEDSNLVGTLSPYVGNLSFLHVIDLNNNNFGGNIPPQIGNLVKLRSLGLINNTFEGHIPPNISCCFNLKALGLDGNHLSGIIPSQLGLLPNLQVLDLNFNGLEGDLLNKVIINMTSLQELNADGNSFHGSIPDNIGAAHKNLRYFSIAQNSISGVIPTSFYNLSQLLQFGLQYNQLHGTLPFDIGVRLPKLTEIFMSGNFFHGKLPASFANLTNLVKFAVSCNNFTGNMFSVRNMPNLIFLEIDQNNLGTGRANDLGFLETLVNSSYLQELECGDNNFGGILPDSLGNLSTLTALDFQLNKIYGSIPSGLYNLVKLRFLDLQGNQLSGYILPQIEKLKNLEILDMDKNYITGNLPNSWGNLSHLGQLYLANNRFQGTIPSSLGNCSNLVHLSLFFNNFSGALPPQLFHASSSMLVSLRLQHNRLQGVIPGEIEQLSNLVQLDVSENTLSGDLPTTLGSCNELVELGMGGNFFTGYIPQSFKSLTSLNFLNLSHNELSGPIPNFFEKFQLFGIDLSFNNFEGEVPRKGVFANLSALKFLGNSKLCGGIPELHLPTCPPNSSKRKGRKLSVAVTTVVALASLVVGVSIVSLAYFLLCSRKKQNRSFRGSELNLVEPFSKVSYDMLLKATNKFSEANLVGVGSFGSVYKGVLDLESNLTVAIKVISLEKKGATKSFMAECEALGSIRHRNLLKIVTVCSSSDFQGNDFKALVYEFMTNGSLHQWIHIDQPERTLSLLQRLEIAIDVGGALDYLHNGCDVPIIHCDLKPSNILLDDGMVAYVGDFGLARLLHLHATASNNSSSSVAVRGTVGYAAPGSSNTIIQSAKFCAIFFLESSVSTEGDIYSYGIVLLEMVTAITPTDRMFEGVLNLHKYAKSALSTDQFFNITDPRLLDDDADSNNAAQEVKVVGHGGKMKCIRSLLEIGVKCSVESPRDRMKIDDAIKELPVAKATLLKELQHNYRISIKPSTRD